MHQQVSDSELTLMKILWSAGGRTTYAAVMEALAEARLVDKGMLKTGKIGRRNEYIALVSEADYQSAQARTLVSKLYAGSAKGLVATLIQGEMLSEEDYRELKRFWESGGGEK